MVEQSYAVDKESKETRNPLGCRNLGYKYEWNTLHLLPKKAGDVQSLFFVFNKSNRPVRLYQMLPDDGARITSLDHAISARQWAVLATDEPELRYICTVEDARSSYGRIVNCADSLKVCEYVRVKFGLNNRGNYWLVGSNTRGGAVGQVVRYGIIPR